MKNKISQLWQTANEFYEQLSPLEKKILFGWLNILIEHYLNK